MLRRLESSRACYGILCPSIDVHPTFAPTSSCEQTITNYALQKRRTSKIIANKPMLRLEQWIVSRLQCINRSFPTDLWHEEAYIRRPFTRIFSVVEISFTWTSFKALSWIIILKLAVSTFGGCSVIVRPQRACDTT